MEAILHNNSLKTNFNRYNRVLRIKHRFLTIKELRNEIKRSLTADRKQSRNKTYNKLDELLN